LLLATTYVLSFSTIWGVATGYINPSEPAFTIVDSSYVTKASTALRLCWVGADFDRANGTIKGPVLGPTFLEAFGSADMITFQGEDEMWYQLNQGGRELSSSPGVSLSDPFRDLYACKLA
jgi:hypothetical protein